MGNYLDEGEDDYFDHIVDHAEKGEDGKGEICTDWETYLPDIVCVEREEEDEGTDDGICASIKKLVDALYDLRYTLPSSVSP